VYFGGGEDEPEELSYDVLIWTGGITSRSLRTSRSRRTSVRTASTPAPTSPPATTACSLSATPRSSSRATTTWRRRRHRPPGRPPRSPARTRARAARRALQSWEHTDKGTVVSVGGGRGRPRRDGDADQDVRRHPAKLLKKSIAVRWIAKILDRARRERVRRYVGVSERHPIRRDLSSRGDGSRIREQWFYRQRRSQIQSSSGCARAIDGFAKRGQQNDIVEKAVSARRARRALACRRFGG